MVDNVKQFILKTLLNCIILFVLLMFLPGNSIFSQTNPGDIVHLNSINTVTKAPVRLTVDNNDNIYTSDVYLNCILKFDPNGNFLDTIYKGVKPLSIAINNNGTVFVGDEESGNILKIGAGGSSTIFYSGLQIPSGMVFGTDGLLYVVDSRRNFVAVLDNAGNLVSSFTHSNMVFPTSIAYDDLNERILVAEHGGFGPDNQNCSTMGKRMSIYCFDFDGNFITEFGCHGSGNGEYERIQGITIGKCGNIYINDPFQAEVTVIDQDLNFVTKFGTFGFNSAETRTPMDVAFDSQERIIISSMNSGKIEIFSITDTLPSSQIAKLDTLICPGQTSDITIEFTGVAPWTFTYTIDGLSPTNVTTSTNPHTLTATTGGLYEVTAITDAIGAGSCFMGSAMVRMASALPSTNITSGDFNLCSGDSAMVDINLAGNAPWTFTYTIDGLNPTNVTTSDSNYSITTFNSGLYEVTAINDSFCVGTTFTGSSNVVINALPTEIFNNGTANMHACEGDTLTIPIDLSGIAPWNFTYTTNGANPITINTSTTPVNLTVYQSNYFTITDLSDSVCTAANLNDIVTVAVHPNPTTDLRTYNSMFCDGDTMEMYVELTGSAPWSLTYTINGADTTTVTNITANPHYFNTTLAGTYEIIAASDAYCTASEFYGSHTIALFDNPLITLLSTTDVSCYGGNDGTVTYSLTGGTPPYAEEWGGENPLQLIAGGHTWYVTDANGCLNTNDFSLNQPDEISITPSLTNANCGNADGSVLLAISGGVAPYVEDWGAANPLQLAGGTYTVIVTDSTGCTNSSTVTILGDTTIPHFTHAINGMQVTFTNNTINADSYLWQFGDGNTSTNPNPIYTYSAPTVYQVILTAFTNGCPDTTYIDTVDFGVGIADVEKIGSFNLYPNPSNGQVTLELDNPNGKPVLMYIYSITGQLVYSEKFEGKKAVHHFDISKQAEGLYIVKLAMDEKIKIQRLVLSE